MECDSIWIFISYFPLHNSEASLYTVEGDSMYVLLFNQKNTDGIYIWDLL